MKRFMRRYKNDNVNQQVNTDEFYAFDTIIDSISENVSDETWVLRFTRIGDILENKMRIRKTIKFDLSRIYENIIGLL